MYNVDYYEVLCICPIDSCCSISHKLGVILGMLKSEISILCALKNDLDGRRSNCIPDFEENNLDTSLIRLLKIFYNKLQYGRIDVPYSVFYKSGLPIWELEDKLLKFLSDTYNSDFMHGKCTQCCISEVTKEIEENLVLLPNTIVTMQLYEEFIKITILEVLRNEINECAKLSSSISTDKLNWLIENLRTDDDKKYENSDFPFYLFIYEDQQSHTKSEDELKKLSEKILKTLVKNIHSNLVNKIENLVKLHSSTAYLIPNNNTINMIHSDSAESNLDSISLIFDPDLLELNIQKITALLNSQPNENNFEKIIDLNRLKNIRRKSRIPKCINILQNFKFEIHAAENLFGLEILKEYTDLTQNQDSQPFDVQNIDQDSYDYEENLFELNHADNNTSSEIYQKEEIMSDNETNSLDLTEMEMESFDHVVIPKMNIIPLSHNKKKKWDKKNEQKDNLEASHMNAKICIEWLEHNFEAEFEYKIPILREKIYSLYEQHCHENHYSLIDSAYFGKCVRKVFTNLKSRRLKFGILKYCYTGIRPKNIIMERKLQASQYSMINGRRRKRKSSH